jgi:pimeloyl-ACP methyl ester carboxylesterase
VPEDPENSLSRRITVHAAVVSATGARALPDPIFVFAGGPGQAASDIAATAMAVFSRLEPRRDVVFVDQRGTGLSAPLSCEDARRRPIEAALDEGASDQRLAECRERFRDAGVDLAQYATWVAVRDVDAIRRALGYERINLWGASYGTRSALEYTRQFPSAVRSIVLDGVAPMHRPLPVALAFDTDLALDQLIARAQLTAEDITSLIDTDVGVIRITDPYFGGPSVAVTLSHHQRLGWLRGPLYVPVLAAGLPYAIKRAAVGDWSPLAGLQAGLSGGMLYSGMHFSVLCAEDVPRITANHRAELMQTRAGLGFVEAYERQCRQWPTRPVPPEVFEPPALSHPVLLLSGGADPATPPRNADEVMRSLSNARHFVAPNLGHGVSATSCGSQLIANFINSNNSSSLDAGCLVAIPAPTFFEPPRP